MALKEYAKAVVGTLVAGLGSLQVALVDNTVSTVEWINVASTAVAALGLVWGVQNSKPADSGFTLYAESNETPVEVLLDEPSLESEPRS